MADEIAAEQLNDQRKRVVIGEAARNAGRMQKHSTIVYFETDFTTCLTFFYSYHSKKKNRLVNQSQINQLINQ